MLEAHVKNVQAHYEKTGQIDGSAGLHKSGIADDAAQAAAEAAPAETAETPAATGLWCLFPRLIWGSSMINV